MNYVIIVLVLGLIGFVLLKYQEYQKSGFNNISDYKFLSVCFNANLRCKYKAYSKLMKCSGEKKILSNVVLRDHHNYVYLDLVMLHETGVYLFSFLNKHGYINADTKAKMWNMEDNNTEFANPLIINKKKIELLMDSLKENNQDYYHSYVIINDSCKIKTLSNATTDKIITMDNLDKELIKDFNLYYNCFTKAKLKEYYLKLLEICLLNYEIQQATAKKLLNKII